MNNPNAPRYSQQDAEKVREYYDAYLASEPGKYSSLEEFNACYEPVLSFIKKWTSAGLKSWMLTVPSVLVQWNLPT